MIRMVYQIQMKSDNACLPPVKAELNWIWQKFEIFQLNGALKIPILRHSLDVLKLQYFNTK